MPSTSKDEPQADKRDEADLAQAYRDLAKGEQTAAALERNLDTLETKLDAILAAMEDKEKNGDKGKSSVN